MRATEEPVSFGGCGSSIFHGNLLPGLELGIILVRVFLVQAKSRASNAVNFHDIGLTSMSSTSMDTIDARGSSASRWWSVEPSRTDIVGLRVGAEVLVSQTRS
jgi:hypothetical protein